MGHCHASPAYHFDLASGLFDEDGANGVGIGDTQGNGDGDIGGELFVVDAVVVLGQGAFDAVVLGIAYDEYPLLAGDFFDSGGNEEYLAHRITVACTKPPVPSKVPPK